MNRFIQIGCGILIYCLLVSAQAAQIEDPQQVVKQTTDAVVAEIGSRKVELEANPTLIYPLVERIMVPRFDSERFTRSAMGRFWRNASSGQKAAIIHEFKQLLMRTYALALLNYSGQKIEYLPVRMKEGENNKALVLTKVHVSPNIVPINYRMALNEEQQWLVYDVIIDGISLITNYRSIFNNSIREGAARAQDKANRISIGIDHLIKTLANKNTNSEAS